MEAIEKIKTFISNSLSLSLSPPLSLPPSLSLSLSLPFLCLYMIFFLNILFIYQDIFIEILHRKNNFIKVSKNLSIYTDL